MQKGFIKWFGGDCPVPEGTTVEVEYRNGEFYVGKALKEDKKSVGNHGATATSGFWRRDESNWDIVAYRVIEQ
jgi:hypothetical protein